MTRVGQHMGRYRILEQLGSGGMSVVYKGLDTTLDREVAVKVLHPHLAGKAESRQRMAVEARAVAKLHHPNILEVFDFSAEEDEEAFLVTEYIRGETVRQFLEREPLGLPEIAAMVIHELASALAHAHAAGVIHRDLKPDNVMIREDGVLKLMDFGIAKILDRDERMTLTGALVGSPAHMAPEIIEGLEAGPAADVFSLGTLLYAFATGSLPFTAPNATATLKRILDGHYTDPRQLVPGLSDPLAEIIATCLARNPADRYAHAGLLRDALASYLSALQVTRVGESVAAFFLDPQGQRERLRTQLIGHWLDQSRPLLAGPQPAKALSLLNQVLALDENNATALALLKELQNKRRRQRRLALAWKMSASLALLAGLSFALVRGWPLFSPALASLGALNPAPPTPVASAPQVEAPGVSLAPEPSPTPEPTAPLASVTPPAPKPSPPAPSVVEVPISVLVRPYGTVRLDEEAPSEEALAQHALKVTPGPHRITVSCDYCEDAVETIEVKARGENVFRLRAQLKPSQVSFDYRPEGAEVRIGDEQRTTQASMAQPFVVTSPKGPASFQHRVAYEVSHPGFQTERREVTLEPGKPTVLRGELLPQ